MKSSNPLECRVAILMIKQRLFHITMTNLLYDQMNMGDGYTYKPMIYTVACSRQAIQEVARTIILNNKADVLITIGTMSSLAVQEIVEETGGFPTVFVGVRKPVELGLVASLDRPGFCLSGVVRTPPTMTAVVEYFIYLYPVIEVIFIPYTEGDSYLLQQVSEIRAYCQARGIFVLSEPVREDAAYVMNVIDEKISQVQGIIFLEGCYCNLLQEAVAYLCWERCVVFCGNGPYAINAGAACAFASEMAQSASAVLKLVRTSWERKIPLGMLPVTVLPDNYEFFVNVEMLRSIDIASDVIERICAQPNVTKVKKWTKPYKE